MGKSRRTGGSFGSNPTATKKSRGELIRDRYSTDRYPTAEDFIRAVEEDPELFDPGSDRFFPHDSGNNFASTNKPGLRGVSGTNLKGPAGKSNWIADNPIDVDVDVDPGALSTSVGLYDDGTNSVRGVVGVDLVPMGIDINVSGDVGSIGLELGAPGDMFGVNVEVSVDVTTGEVIGGGVGLEGGGLAVTVNQTTHKGKTCSSITVTYFGVGASYQHCKKDDDEGEEPPKEPPPPPNDDLEYPPFPVLPRPTGRETGQWCTLTYATAWAEVEIWGGRAKYIAGTTTRTRGELYPMSLFNQAIANRPEPHTPIIEYLTQKTIKSIGGKMFQTTSAMGIGYYYYAAIHDSFAPGDTELGFGPCEFRDKPMPPKPPPPIPPEDDDMGECCNLEPVMSMLRKLNQALAVDEIVDQGLELPNEWILPTGKGHSKMNNYLQIAVFLAKMQDHLGVHPMTIQIADLSAGQEGNQEFKKFYPNGTKAIQEILTILHDENSDSADRLNLQMRLAILNTRIFITVASIARSIRGIFQFLGAPLKERRDLVPLPFDYTYGLRKNKGFSQNAAQDASQLEETMKKLEAELNKNQETATEALLAKFLNDSEQPIIFETFDGSQPDLLALLRVLTTIKGKTNG